MTQQFRIDSESLRDKLNTLLPSQARGAINVDLSGQTTIVPIVDLTETAEGSSLRIDLQTSLSLTSVTSNAVNNATTDLVTTPGYYRVFGTASFENGSSGGTARIQITDGFTSKILFSIVNNAMTGSYLIESFDFIVKVVAGDTLQAVSPNTRMDIAVTTRQIATIAGDLVNP